MSIFLNALGSDNFTRANENPLSQGGNWTDTTFGNNPLQIVSDLCEGTVQVATNAELYSGVALPNDQYASVTWATYTVDNTNIRPGIRMTDNGSNFVSLPGYQFRIQDAGSWTVFVGGSIGMSGSVTISAGDVFTIAAIGTTIYAFHNSTLLGSFTDATYSSGISGLLVNTYHPLTEVQVSNWVVGSAATTGAISGNAGVAGALVSYSGTASGSVTADGSGNYSITGLSAGNYTITPSLSGYSFSPASQNVTLSTSNATGINFTATATSTAGPSAAVSPAYIPRRIQLFGILSSGANAGEVCAVACDSNGNLALSGGSGGVINTIDVLGLPADAVPAMVYGAVSGSTVPGSTALVAVAVDQYGNILASRGTGGGTPTSTVDTPVASDTGVTAVQIFARAPNGAVIGVPVSSTGALGNTLNQITNVPVTQIDEAQVEDSPLPFPVLLCGRIASGYPNAGEIIGVQLDSTGALCVSGSSGASTAPTQVTTFNNGECALLQLYGRDSAGQMVSVPLTSSGSLFLH